MMKDKNALWLTVRHAVPPVAKDNGGGGNFDPPTFRQASYNSLRPRYSKMLSAFARWHHAWLSVNLHITRQWSTPSNSLNSNDNSIVRISTVVLRSSNSRRCAQSSALHAWLQLKRWESLSLLIIVQIWWIRGNLLQIKSCHCLVVVLQCYCLSLSLAVVFTYHGTVHSIVRLCVRGTTFIDTETVYKQTTTRFSNNVDDCVSLYLTLAANEYPSSLENHDKQFSAVGGYSLAARATPRCV